MGNGKSRFMVECGRCGRGVVGRISIAGKVQEDGTDTRGYTLDGAVIPFTPELSVELMRRGYAGMCIPCWEGKPIPSPIDDARPKVFVGDD